MKQLPSDQKIRGGYYTPPAIAAFLTRWAVQKKGARILEPSCGDGVFLQEAAQRLQGFRTMPAVVAESITAVELHCSQALIAQEHLRSRGFANAKVLIGDFFSHCLANLRGSQFDAIIGNPPFIRYQTFAEEFRDPAFTLMRKAGLHPNRLTNAWVPFVAQATQMLAPSGRLAMVVPAELLHVGYAAELRLLLSQALNRLTVFTFKRLVFDGIQQEVVLLCGERTEKQESLIRMVELDGLDDLADYEHPPFEKNSLKPLNHSTEKWIQYFLSRPELEFIRRINGRSDVSRLGSLADVDVGVVTGLNEFFVLNDEKKNEVSAGEFVLPLVARSGHLSGLIFRKSDWQMNLREGLSVFLLNLGDRSLRSLPAALIKYIKHGEREGWHKGYKCQIRTPWYKVPSIWTPDAFMLRQIHDSPRIISNAAQAICTDTIHRVKVQKGIDPKLLSGAAMNSMTFAFSEILGRSYGGGVLELEPTEAEELPIPYQFSSRLNIEQMDAQFRKGQLESVLDYADKILLQDGLGFEPSEVTMLRHIWHRLRDRRHRRKVRDQVAGPQTELVPA